MINKNYLKLNESYLFSTIAKKVKNCREENKNSNIISLGIGDVTLPLAPEVVKAITLAAKDMSEAETFKGYGDEQGYSFLREELKKYYLNKNVELELSEIFVGDGAKSDLGNILDIFDENSSVLIPDPVYPVYVDTNIMDGRKITLAASLKENNFVNEPPEEKYDIIYICSPNNPTGSVYDRITLEKWVKYAKKHSSVILFDAAYEAFITDDLPSSIYQIEGAKEVAIEFGSFSKTAGFTGVRCGYTIVPKSLTRESKDLNHLWLRRQTTKFNGVSYITQRAAASVFSSGTLISSVKTNIKYYLDNAKIIKDCLDKKNIWSTGGVNSPYIWFMIPDSFDSSWEFFDQLLEKQFVVGTPGIGFGNSGDKFFRFTAFAKRENVEEAVSRLNEFFYNL